MARVFDSKDKLVQNYQPPASYKEKFIQKINEKNAYSSARGSKTSSANVTAVEFAASRKYNSPEIDIFLTGRGMAESQNSSFDQVPLKNPPINSNHAKTSPYEMYTLGARSSKNNDEF